MLDVLSGSVEHFTQFQADNINCFAPCAELFSVLKLAPHYSFGV